MKKKSNETAKSEQQKNVESVSMQQFESDLIEQEAVKQKEVESKIQEKVTTEAVENEPSDKSEGKVAKELDENVEDVPKLLCMEPGIEKTPVKQNKALNKVQQKSDISENFESKKVENPPESETKPQSSDVKNEEKGSSEKKKKKKKRKSKKKVRKLYPVFTKFKKIVLYLIIN